MPQCLLLLLSNTSKHLSLKASEPILITRHIRLAHARRNTNILALVDKSIRRNIELDRIGPVAGIPIGHSISVANLQRRVRADELGVDLKDQDRRVGLIRVYVAWFVAVDLAGVDGWRYGIGAVGIREEDESDGGPVLALGESGGAWCIGGRGLGGREEEGEESEEG